MGWVDHYFSCSTLCRGSWADGKLADLAEQPRKMVEHHTKSQSQPNPTVRADAPPCFQDTSGYPTRTPRNSLTNWARERTTVATASDSDERAESLAGERALMLCGRSVPSPSIVPSSVESIPFFRYCWPRLRDLWHASCKLVHCHEHLEVQYLSDIMTTSGHGQKIVTGR